MERRRAHSSGARGLHLRHLAPTGMVVTHEIEAESHGRIRVFRASTVSLRDRCDSKCAPWLTQSLCSVIIPIGLRLEYINHAAISSRSIYTSVAVTAITTITTHIAIMSSTLPCLKQFLAMFESGMIGEFSDATYTGSGKGTRTDTSIALA